MSPPSAELEEAARGIEGWLLGSGAQLAGGAHEGGVAGWLDARGQAEFVYLEITGYYLTTLTWLAEGGAKSAAVERGRAALAWLRAVTADGALPPTRLYLSSAPDDWRNRAVFSFDLAMAARGVGCFAEHVQGGETRALLAGLGARLTEACGPSAPLASHALTDGDGELPERWSTRPGPHHVKAAAAILGLPAGLVDARLAGACRVTVAHWAAQMQSEWPCEELHPLLYGVEGLLTLSPALGEEALGPAEEIYRSLLALQAPDGSLPAARGSAAVRSDVLAQALRAGALLRAAGRLEDEAWTERLDALAGALLRHVGPDGAVPFALDQDVANTWCAMFAHQALLLHAHRADEALAARATRLLV